LTETLYGFGHLAIITTGLIFEFFCYLPFRLAMRIAGAQRR